MDPFATKKKKTKTPNYQNFIEAFKDIGSSTVKSFTKDVIKGTAQNAINILTKNQPQSPNQPSPDKDFNFEEFINQQEKKIRHQERTRFEAIRREEKVIYSREQQQVKIQVQTLQAQIKELAKEQAGLMEEVDKTAFQAVSNPGVYHRNFFERLINLIKLAKKRVTESKTWLQMHNHRAKKRAGYWGQVKKSGTSFMLSGERSIATQAG